MLVLSRKPGESIMVGDTEVKVLRVREGKVDLGTTARSEIPVHRREVYEAIRRNEGKERPQP